MNLTIRMILTLTFFDLHTLIIIMNSLFAKSVVLFFAVFLMLYEADEV